MRKKDCARVAFLGVLARRGVQLSPHVEISVPAEMFAELLPSLIQTMLRANSTDNIAANLRLVGNELTVQLKACPYGSAVK